MSFTVQAIGRSEGDMLKRLTHFNHCHKQPITAGVGMVAASRAGQDSATATVEVEITVELMTKSGASFGTIKHFHAALKLLISYSVSYLGFINIYHHITIYQ